MVAAGDSVLKAAESVGCGKSTSYRIAKTEEFQAEVNRLRTELLRDAVGKLAGAASLAVESMVGLLKSEDENTRLKAANAVLERFGKLSDAIDLRARVEALEQAAKASKQ